MEGDGEVSALPILLRRMAAQWSPDTVINPLQPIRVRRDKFLNKEEEFRRQLLLAAAKTGEDGWILIVLDADDDCPARLGQKIFERARQYVPHRRLSVVLANREFEAWFIAAAPSLDGARGFSIAPTELLDAETPRNAKGWMREHMQSGTYSEILDQPAFTARMDLQQALDNSRSFRKLHREWQTHVSQRP
ncbi:DUF4276 family protein [Paraburkholderia sp. WSM4180]|uniref:DUF4276 family protein n=1 Tax=Paraburkholderia sp. WSM4180 TaxID=2723099 RepID=UPI00288A625E|nr:DUF4276 family protein [Paraburkholderia sp. WSM4180]